MLVAEKLREVVELNDESDIPKITASFGVTQISATDSQKVLLFELMKLYIKLKKVDEIVLFV
jgi:GGDEF domain-containing protein